MARAILAAQLQKLSRAVFPEVAVKWPAHGFSQVCIYKDLRWNSKRTPEICCHEKYDLEYASSMLTLMWSSYRNMLLLQVLDIVYHAGNSNHERVPYPTMRSANHYTIFTGLSREQSRAVSLRKFGSRSESAVLVESPARNYYPLDFSCGRTGACAGSLWRSAI